jgi:hypothetical protein
MSAADDLRLVSRTHVQNVLEAHKFSFCASCIASFTSGYSFTCGNSCVAEWQLCQTQVFKHARVVHFDRLFGGIIILQLTNASMRIVQLVESDAVKVILLGDSAVGKSKCAPQALDSSPDLNAR